MNWPPDTVQTPMGEQPFTKAIRWHLPTILRDIAMTAAIGRDGSGSFASQTLQIAADRLELLAEQIKLLRGPDVLPADAVRAEMGEGL